MKIEQLYTACLSHGAYYIESNGEAAIIDPLREVQQYIDLAQRRNATIKYIFETHFHADFVSGHIDLSKKTGAPIVYGPTTMKTGFESTIASDGQEFKIGDVTVRVIHTPGHTLESSCYLLIDENGEEKAIFTGDTLFIGDVGRPDLAQHVIADLTEEKLAKMLYYSLRNKILPLNDQLIVYPGHGAGSACGKKLSKETFDTLGNQKKTNSSLRAELTENQFVKELLTGLTPPPEYFPKNVLLNIGGYESIDTVIDRGNKALSPEAFELVKNETNALVIDTRNPEEFVNGFIPDSINIGLEGSFAVWAGTLIKDINQKILLVTPPGKEKEVITRLARVGYDHTIGYLDGGFETWKKAKFDVDKISSINVSELANENQKDNSIYILDVRKKSEFDSEHIVNAINIPLDYVENNLESIDKSKTGYVHCAGGYRSVIFISILKAKGYSNLINVNGGFKAIKDSEKFSITNYVCPTTML